MKKYKLFYIFIMLILSNSSWAYGGGSSSSSKACEKPKFTDFVPVKNTEVTPGSAFSFTASKNTYPTKIHVTVKGHPVSVTTTQKNDGTFHVTSNLPRTINSSFARITITAEGQSNCKGTGGWLIKVN